MARHIKTRDYAMLAIINGATKAGTHRDARKHASSNACRGESKMLPARKKPDYDIVFEWTREAEHGGMELFDVYAKQTPSGYNIVAADIIDSDGEAVTFNLISFSDAEMIALKNAAGDEWESLYATQH